MHKRKKCSTLDNHTHQCIDPCLNAHMHARPCGTGQPCAIHMREPHEDDAAAKLATHRSGALKILVHDEFDLVLENIVV